VQNAAGEILGHELSLSPEELEKAVSPENFVNVRTIYGGTAPVETKRALSIEREHELVDTEWFVLASDSLKKASENLKKITTEKTVEN
jgi:argininosuccinate lyase